MSVITGKLGDVRFDAGVSSDSTFPQLYEVTGWDFSAEVNEVEYASNITAGVTVTIAGSKSASGSIEGVWNTATPITTQIEEGDTGTLRLYLTTSHYIVVPCVITSMEIELDIQDNPITWTSEYRATAAWTYPAALGSLVDKKKSKRRIKPADYEAVYEELGAESGEDRARIRQFAALAARQQREHPGSCKAAA